MTFKAVTIDFIGTLINGHTRAELFAALSEIAKEDPVLTPLLMEAAMKYGPTRREDIMNLKQTTIAERIEAAAEEHHVSIDADALVALNDKVFEYATSESKLYDDVEATLKALRERELKVALISNVSFPGSYYSNLLESLGIAHFFDAVYWSSDTRVRKPGTEMFEMALKSLNVEPKEAMHVGNVPNRDVRGAHAAGMQAVWINRHEDELDAREDKPNWEIQELSELIPILDSE